MFHIFVNNSLIYQPSNDQLRLISPKLTVEIGKAGSLEFDVPPTNLHYDDLQQLKALLTVYQDTTEIFRGRVLTNKRNFNNIRNVYAEGNLAYLIDSVQKAEKYTGKAHALFRQIIDKHNAMIKDPEKQFTVGYITVDDTDVYIAGQSDEIIEQESTKFNYKQIAINSVADEWKTSFDYIESCLLDYVGGYLRTRYDEINKITYIDWLKDYYSTSTQLVELGTNILDLTEEVSAEDLFTVLIPIGDENLTIEKANNGSNELVNEEMVAKYGRIVRTQVFDSVNDPYTLLENGRRYLENNVEVPVTLTVNAVDLHLIYPDIQTILVGDKLHVISPAHEVDDSELVCTKIEYDLANPANTVYTFGKPKQSLTERYRKDKRKADDSAGRGGGGGGSAVDAAEEELTDEIEKKTRDATLVVDPDNAQVSLQAWAETVNNGIKALKEVGIKLDGEANTVDIYALRDEYATTIGHLKKSLGIKLNGEDGEIDIFASAERTVDNAGAIARIKAWAGYDESTGKYGSNIALQADLVSINAKLTEISGALTVSSSGTFGSYVQSSGFWGNYFIRQGTEISQHTHSISESNGVVKIGTVDKWGEGVTNSFNIADTKFYKDAVSAAAANAAASIKFTVTPAHRTHTYSITAEVKNSEGTVVLTDSTATDATMYNAGAGSVYCTSANASGKPGTGPYGSKYLNVVVYLSNGTSTTKTVYYSE